MKQIRLHVKGKVQGVFFRASTQKKAQELSLTGYVMNEPDGSVTIVAEGEEVNLDALYVWSKQGPQHAKVEAVTLQQGPVEGYASFQIRR